MIDVDLAWTVEDACLNAWPAARQIVSGSWLLRAAGGPSRRINCVTPLRAAAFDPGAVLAVAEPLYAGLGRPLIMRVPDLAAGLAPALARRGFRAQHPTRTLFSTLAGREPRTEAGVTVAAEPTPAWLALRARLAGENPDAARALAATLDVLMLPRAFVSVEAGSAVVAGAFGVVHHGLLVIEAVGTDRAERARGHARRVVGALMDWGFGQGAHGACLQVLARNDPALRLYAALGFATDLYDYAYFARDPIA